VRESARSTQFSAGSGTFSVRAEERVRAPVYIKSVSVYAGALCLCVCEKCMFMQAAEEGRRRIVKEDKWTR
jgi:hypothetical protein